MGSEHVVTVKQSRFAYIDIAKAIGIIMVVYAHTSLDGALYQLFYSFHIPLFFFVSGLTFDRRKNTGFGKFAKGRAKSLLLPYLIYSLITFGWWLLVERVNGAWEKNPALSALEIILARGSSNYIVHNPALWFIPCLFLTELVYYFISQTKDWLKILVCVFLSVCGYLMTQPYAPTILRELPWSIEAMFSALPFFLVGNLIGRNAGKKKMHDIIENGKWLSGICALVLTVALVFLSNLNGKVSLGSNVLGNYFLYYINGFIGTFVILILSVFIEKLISQPDTLSDGTPNTKPYSLKKEKLENAILWLGQETYAIMAIHYPIKRIAIRMTAQAIGKTGSFVSNHVGYSAIAFAVTLVLSIILVMAAQEFQKSIKKPGLQK